MIALRPYQEAAIDAVRTEYQKGRRRVLLVLATGLGKTVVFSEIARRTVERGRRALVLAHRAELLEQAVAKLRAIGVNAEIEQADRRAGDASVVVASVQTMRGARLEGWARDAFSLVVIDEAHHATAQGYRAIVERFSSAYLLGVTATPDRLDGVGLGEVFESIAYRYELRQAIRDGWLAPIRARRIKIESVDLGGVHTKAGDFDTRELANAMNNEHALHGVAAPLLEMIGTRRGIAFAVDVAHAHALADVLNGYRNVARALDGSAAQKLRADTLAAFAANEFQVLVNVALLTEGFDDPGVSCIAIARPTKSRALYTQIIGRGTRLAPDKSDCLVLDFTGNAGRHRLVGPADALAGEEEMNAARVDFEALLESGEMDVEDAIAEALVRSERKAREAVVRFATEEIDPFVSGWPAEPAGEWTAEPATEAQRSALERFGLEKIPPKTTKGDASRWLAALSARRHAGLCTLKQARWLRRRGVDARNTTFERASALIDAEIAIARRGAA